MHVYQSQAKTKSFNNTDMPAKGMLTTVSLILFFCKESSIIIYLMIYTFAYNIKENEYKLGMKICIMHFASSLLRILLVKIVFL